MAVIGATQLEPVNVLGQYVQGLEAGRAARAQRQKEAQAMQLQNMLMGATSEQLESPEFINRLTVMPGGAEVAKTLSESAAAQRTARKEDLDIAIKQGEVIAREAGAFLDDPASLSKATIDAWAQGAVQRGLLSQEAYARFQQLPDDPNVLGPAMQRLQTQGLSLADQLRYQRITPEAMLPYEQALSPDVEAQKIRIGQATRPVTNITTVAERAEAGKFGESLVADYTAIRDRAESGRRFLTTIDQAQRALSEGLRTGFGAEAIRQGARVLAALGEPEAEAKAANAELFLAAAKENVLRRQIEQKGPQTESDAARIEQTFINLGSTPQANQFMLDVARAQINRDNEQQRFYSKWRRENGTFDGAEEAWLDGEGSKSLFDRPELKKYESPQAASDKPVKVKNVEEARNLAPGTLFETPDGRIKVR